MPPTAGHLTDTPNPQAVTFAPIPQRGRIVALSPTIHPLFVTPQVASQ